MLRWMIVEYIRYAIPNHRGPELEAAYLEAREALDASPHCLGYELARGHEEPDKYILRIEWDSIDGHLEGFRGSEEFQRFLVHVRPFLSMIEEMKHYVVTGVTSEQTRRTTGSSTRR